jgi:hypothetical protein
MRLSQRLFQLDTVYNREYGEAHSAPDPGF